MGINKANFNETEREMIEKATEAKLQAEKDQPTRTGKRISKTDPVFQKRLKEMRDARELVRGSKTTVVIDRELHRKLKEEADSYYLSIGEYVSLILEHRKLLMNEKQRQ